MVHLKAYPSLPGDPFVETPSSGRQPLLMMVLYCLYIYIPGPGSRPQSEFFAVDKSKSDS